MTTPVVCLGSVSSHGGTIITASSSVTAGGVPVARMGDLHVCPITGHGVTPLMSSSTVTDAGIPVARAFVDMTGCGATIVSGCPNVSA